MPKLSPEQVARLDPFNVRGKSASEKLEKVLKETSLEGDLQASGFEGDVEGQASQEPVDEELKLNRATSDYIREQILLGNEKVIQAVLPELKELEWELIWGGSIRKLKYRKLFDVGVTIFHDQLKCPYRVSEGERIQLPVRRLALKYAYDVLDMGNPISNTETFALVKEALFRGDLDVVLTFLWKLEEKARSEVYWKGSSAEWSREAFREVLDHSSAVPTEEGLVFLCQAAEAYKNNSILPVSLSDAFLSIAEQNKIEF